MAESVTSPEIFWVDPKKRGILPLKAFRVPKSLRKRIRRSDYTVTVDKDFEGVLAGCADRDETWINPEIRDLYGTLHRLGYAHSIEVWMDGELAGGLYGVRLGAAFFGESMFARRTDASKIALVYLIARLKAGGFTLLDTQFVTDHLRGFGAVEAPRAHYHKLLEGALQTHSDFWALSSDATPDEILQLSTQTS